MWLLKFLGGIKVYLFLGLGLLATMAGVRWRYVEKKNDRLEEEIDEHEAVLDNKDRIEKADKKTKKKTESRRAEARNEVKKPKHSDSIFSNPGKLRNNKKDRD